MDRQSTIGFVLIFVVLLAWMWLNAPDPKKQAAATKTTQVADTVRTPVAAKPAPIDTTTQRANQFGSLFNARATGRDRIITIETDLFRAELTAKGGLIKSWKMKSYKAWNGVPVELVNDPAGDFSLLFTTADGKVLNTRDLYFDVRASSNSVVLTNNFEFEVIFSLPTSSGGRIEKVFKFKNGEYGFTADVRMVNMQQVLAGYEYQIVWEHGVRYAEHRSDDESQFAAAYAYGGSELTELDAANFDETYKKDMSGIVDWVAARNKYFAVALIPTTTKTEGAFLGGTRHHANDRGVTESYVIALKMPFKGGSNESVPVRVFLGPIQIDLLKSFQIGLEKIMSLGWAWLIRPISEYVLLPLFMGINYLIPNWGLVIIIFSIIIKIALHPLTKSSMNSMQRMQKLQPLMEEIREKYKDDPQKMNSSVMNLYKEYGVNPMGGCLPVLLQLPIMYALYSVFRAAIELRQAGFVGWITDLSVPDVMVTLPFTLPLFNIQDVSGIALLMGITMFVQQKMTVKDPRQKAMIWMMPIMMTLLFNSFPSGLNLYYAVFNALSIGQQAFVNKQHSDEPLRKVEQKKSRGGIFKFAKDLPRLKK
jgi:YidC/Oxa1 family membrane protein insertase